MIAVLLGHIVAAIGLILIGIHNLISPPEPAWVSALFMFLRAAIITIIGIVWYNRLLMLNQ